MGAYLSKEKATYIWGKSVVKGLDLKREIENRSVKEKISIAKSNMKILFIFDWVKFIGISGSVGALTSKRDDDIDVYIVVKDGCAWIYRGLVVVRNIFNHTVRTKGDRDRVSNLFCINYISEERGIFLEDDMFNFHELMYIYPLYGEKYLKYIYSCNRWLRDRFFVKKELFITRISKSKPVNILIRVINFGAYISQILFMYVAGHRPETGYIINDYKNGKIRFFPRDFKKKVLRGFRAI
jgi:hypothetical protein